ncbi:HIRAN domain-containing protein [Myroides odoratimimus]|uniref:HIRAN domain-containing protein n=1 Tax=Myroides odoratimimus TaxID=76832 RepID=UPI002574D591|nr:HIRAN domain-containing protein [Myroides odoratimimus]MDM1325891.1 hypothetical protein [Myroides odoratimimus]
MGDFILFILLFIVLFVVVFKSFLFLSNLFKKFINIDNAFNQSGISENTEQPSLSKTKQISIKTFEVDETNRQFITMDFRVVGIGYSQSTKDACAYANKIHLVPENNPHDKNAVAVYNQNNERIGYIPRGDKEFLAAFHSYKGNTVKIINQHHNEDEYPVKYCELDIRVTFCGDFEYLKKVESEEPECYSLLEKLADIRKEIKNKEISDSNKYDKISNLNHLILDFNKRAEKVNWVTIPMKETIILMNKLKLDTQLEFIETHFNYSDHSTTQYDYITNYIERNKK